MKRSIPMAVLALIAVLVLAVGCSHDDDGTVVGDDGETTAIVGPSPPTTQPTPETTVEEPTLPDTSGVV